MPKLTFTSKDLALKLDAGCTCRRESGHYIVRDGAGVLIGAGIDNTTAWKRARLRLLKRD